MKKILLDNALESWSIAVKYCKYIKNGMVTLHYQKTFVSSLHNSVELFLKQIMIDNNDHNVASLFEVENEADATLQLEYYKSKELNRFFKELNDKKRYKFRSIFVASKILIIAFGFSSNTKLRETISSLLYGDME